MEQLSIFDLPVVEEIPEVAVAPIPLPQPIAEVLTPVVKSKPQAKSVDRKVRGQLAPTDLLIKHLEVKAAVYLGLMNRMMQNANKRRLAGVQSPSAKAEIVRLHKMRMCALQRAEELRKKV